MTWHDVIIAAIMLEILIITALASEVIMLL